MINLVMKINHILVQNLPPERSMVNGADTELLFKFIHSTRERALSLHPLRQRHFLMIYLKMDDTPV